MKKHLYIVLGVVLIFSSASGQTNQDLKEVQAAINLQKTANTKDLLTTFFRASIDNILGKDHSYTLNSSLYGLDSIFRKKGSSISFARERSLRQTSLDVSLKGDSSNKLTQLGFGITFTLVNKKDLKYNQINTADFQSLLTMQLAIANLKRAIMEYIATKHTTEYNDISVNRTINNSWNNASLNHNFSSLHPYILEALNDPTLQLTYLNDSRITTKPTAAELQALLNSLLTGKDVFEEQYQNIAQKYSYRPLWTFSPAGMYDPTNNQGEFGLSSAFTVGLTKDPAKKPWELEAKGSIKIGKDTTLKSTNYDSKPFSISLGVNKVLIQNEQKESKMEMKFFSQYDYQFGTVAPGKEAGLFTVNTTFRINVFKSLWLPLTLKYDPDGGNLFGFISVTANLGN